MRIIEKSLIMQQTADEIRNGGGTIGLVPTMGFFHEGHLSLMRQSVKECDITVVSLFVNPAQFDPGEDLDRYPKDFERDKELAEKAGVDILFAPLENEMYSPNHETCIEVKSLSSILCGISRPTHFKGVTTIVAKLFNLVKPHRAFFGQKDAQQAIIIKKMTKELNYDIDIQVLPIIRESDGLAMSSRNKYLSHEERNRALCLKKALDSMKKKFHEGINTVEDLRYEGLSIINAGIDTSSDRMDYLEIRDAEDLTSVSSISRPVFALLAVCIGDTRLIDNMILNNND